MSLLLKNVSWHDGEKITSGNIFIERDRILDHSASSETAASITVDCANHFLYPGLVNAHDHLEMNLYPRLGTPPYENYTQWSRDIYKPEESPIKEIESVSVADRLAWGGIKNLISGVTTVIHHNPWNKIFDSGSFPVNVCRTSWAHSLAFGKNLKSAFTENTAVPFVIHAAEGVDELAAAEIDLLDGQMLLSKRTVLVHAVGVTPKQRKLLLDMNVGVVWCPVSNHFMFDKTLNIEDFSQIRTMIGSDSTLTGSPTLLDELQFAHRTSSLTEKELFRMVTAVPADVFSLDIPVVAVNSLANLFVTTIRSNDYFENLMEIKHADIQLVVVQGQIHLQGDQIKSTSGGPDHDIIVEGERRKVVSDVAALRKRILKKVPLGWLSKNQLWNMIE
jgi:cytosine/adenosine deaminase-related metal-dependent hydrolase